jgi:hypothetical protein
MTGPTRQTLGAVLALVILAVAVIVYGEMHWELPEMSAPIC